MSYQITPAVLPDDTPRARHDDPLQSHEAADTNDIWASRDVVLSILHEVGGCTDYEIETICQSEGVTYTPQRLRTARKALEDDGVVRKVEGVFRKARRARAQVYCLNGAFR